MTTRDQYYLFTVPGDELVWAETYLGDGAHVVAPTPYSDTQDALDYLQRPVPEQSSLTTVQPRRTSPRCGDGRAPAH